MERVRKRERALLAALRLPRQRRFEVEESLDELGRLAESAGAEVVGRITQERQAPTAAVAWLAGRGDRADGWPANLGLVEFARWPAE